MSMQKMFHPRSIAIIGVSENPKKVGHIVAKNMLDQGYKGNLYFIHPKAQELLGKKVYSNVSAIGKRIDLAVLAVPAPIAITYLDQLADVGCRNVVIFAAGFKENNSDEGTVREKELLEKAEKHSINILGPNCLGFVNTEKNINATFLKYTVPKGNIGIISQSGALGSALVDYIVTKSYLGFSYFVSLGNKSVIDESDILEYLTEDSKTKVIGMYLEDVKDGERFQKTLLKSVQKKPVVILKAGRTEEGSQAAMSHTGSLAGSDEVFDSVIRQSGAIRADSFAEFEILLKLFSLNSTPHNRNILVLSNAGGMGVLLTDELVKHNLNLITVSDETKNLLIKSFEELKKISIHNPIDLLGDASAYDYERAITLTQKEKDVGGVIIILTPQANTEIEKTAKTIHDVYDKVDFNSIYPIFMGKASVSDSHVYFEKNGISSFRYFALLPKILDKILRYKEHIALNQRDQVSEPHVLSLSVHTLDVKTVLMENEEKDFLNQFDSLHILEQAGIKVAKTYLATHYDDLDVIVQREGFPLVAKIASENITHKTEVKGVLTGITNNQELYEAFKILTSITSRKDGCYIQSQYSGHELIVGVKKDPTFGTVLVVGLGGIYAELLEEVIRLVYPFSFEDFIEALQHTKLAKLQKEFRNIPPVDFSRVFDVAQKLGKLASTFKQIKEIDINPLMVNGSEVTAVDARVILY